MPNDVKRGQRMNLGIIYVGPRRFGVAVGVTLKCPQPLRRRYIEFKNHATVYIVCTSARYPADL
jgi:hypothetical protein